MLASLKYGSKWGHQPISDNNNDELTALLINLFVRTSPRWHVRTYVPIPRAWKPYVVRRTQLATYLLAGKCLAHCTHSWSQKVQAVAFNRSTTIAASSDDSNGFSARLVGEDKPQLAIGAREEIESPEYARLGETHPELTCWWWMVWMEGRFCRDQSIYRRRCRRNRSEDAWFRQIMQRRLNCERIECAGSIYSF